MDVESLTMSVAEAAEMLGIPRRTLYDFIAKGTPVTGVVVLRAGSRIRIATKPLLAALGVKAAG